MAQPRDLAELDAAAHRDDPHFANGLRHGRPVAPREYRQAAFATWTVAAAVAQVLAMLAGQTSLSILFGLAALGLAAWMRHHTPR
jgi:hypothetical protein